MKRILCLFLCLLMLFCIGCKKEEPEPVYGEQYISGGYVYNTHVRMRLVTEELKPPKTVVSELRAPVKSITVEIQNDTDYYVDPYSITLRHCEKWENGEWVEIPHAYIYVNFEENKSSDRAEWISPHSDKQFEKDFVPDDPTSISANPKAQSLGEGVYRLVHTVSLCDKDSYQKVSECMLEIHFTVAPSLD